MLPFYVAYQHIEISLKMDNQSSTEANYPPHIFQKPVNFFFI